MNRHLGERLLTIEEATALSYLEPVHGTRDEKKPSIWSWQTVAGALEQRVSDEQVDRVLRRRK